MTRSLRTKSSFRLFAFIALTAMMMRALVPTGWMVASAEDGQSLSIQLCSGDWVQWDLNSGDYAAGDAAQDEPQHSDHDMDGQPCPFAASAQIDAPAEWTFVTNTPLVLVRQTGISARGPPLKASNLPALPARGPPLFI